MRLSLAALDLLYVSLRIGSQHFVSSFDRIIRLVAMTVLALALGANAVGLRAARGRSSRRRARSFTQQGPVEIDAEGRPIAPPGERKRLPIDALLD